MLKKKKKDYVAVEWLLDVILERAQGKKKKKEMCRESIHILREYKNTYVQNVDRNSGH